MQEDKITAPDVKTHATLPNEAGACISLQMEIEENSTIKVPRKGIQSLERAFALLETIAAHSSDGITLAELSKQVGLHTSTTFHLVRTMEDCGYIRKLKDSKRYSIGAKLFSLAAGTNGEIDLATVVAPVLDQLSETTGETSHFAVMTGSDIVVSARAKSPGVFQLQENNGATRPGHATALGKAILAQVSREDRDRYFRGHPLISFTDKTVTDRDVLEAELERVGREGIAYDDGEMNLELRCVAAVVWNRTSVAGAIGVSGPVWRLSLPKLNEVANQVREAAFNLSVTLGAKFPSSD